METCLMALAMFSTAMVRNPSATSCGEVRLPVVASISAAIAGRPRDRARRLRSHPQPHAIETADRAAAGGDGVDPEHRRAHPDARNHRLMCALESAGIVRDIRR